MVVEEEEKMTASSALVEPTKSRLKGNKKRKAGAQVDEVDAPTAKKKHNGSTSPAPFMNPTIAAASRAVVNSLAEEERGGEVIIPSERRREKETFMTMETFTRVYRGFLSQAGLSLVLITHIFLVSQYA